jgi:hypothetical protein
MFFLQRLNVNFYQFLQDQFFKLFVTNLLLSAYFDEIPAQIVYYSNAKSAKIKDGLKP